MLCIMNDKGAEKELYDWWVQNLFSPFAVNSSTVCASPTYVLIDFNVKKERNVTPCFSSKNNTRTLRQNLYYHGGGDTSRPCSIFSGVGQDEGNGAPNPEFQLENLEQFEKKKLKFCIYIYSEIARDVE